MAHHRRAGTIPPTRYTQHRTPEGGLCRGGNYGARKGSGIVRGSISLHPGGHGHGPQPGAVERSLGAESFDEPAVVADTFRPLELGEGGPASEDPGYAWTWAGRGLSA
jgi:homogentisate 1,2-dioxygenase